MVQLFAVGIALLLAAALYCRTWFYKMREEFDGLPMPPMDKFWGHLIIAGEIRRLFPPNVHVQCWFPYIRKRFGLGDFFYLDLRPFGPKFLAIADPELASRYATTGQSLPKATLVIPYITQLLGPLNMITIEGEQWKALRSTFNPGFSAAHITTLVPYIVSSTLIFVDKLRKNARTNEFFSMDEATTSLTIDVIGKVALDINFDSQLRSHPLVDTFRRQIALMPQNTGVFAIDIAPLRPLQRWLNGRRLNALVGEEFDRHARARQLNRSSSGTMKASSVDRKRSIIDLALDAYEEANRDSKEKLNSLGVSPAFRTAAIDSLKSFIFAGHDTTASTISYALYFLHLHPHVHKKVVDEVNAIFGADSTSSSIAETIRNEPYIINKLEYLIAVIKETLRLFPPASTMREIYTSGDAKDLAFFDPRTNRSYPLQGFQIWVMGLVIHRNEDFFPKPIHFIPERFIPSQTPFPDAKLFTPAGKDAWRPFERGPRNCIGQELAMIEIRIVLATVCKEFDFVPEYYGEEIHEWTPVHSADEFSDGVPGTTRMRIEGHRPYQVLNGTAKARDGLTGRVKLRAP